MIKTLPLLAEAALDDRFNVQIGKIQDAVQKLMDISDEMTKPGSMTKPVRSQILALARASNDLKEIAEKMSLAA